MLIEAKYNPYSTMNYDWDRFNDIADRVKLLGKKRANVLLLVVTNNNDNKLQLLQYLNQQTKFDLALQVKVYTEHDLKNLNN